MESADFRSQQDYLRAEIRRELKIKEGAETLQKCSKDKKTKTHVNNILKQTNSRLKELHEKLDWLNKQVQDYPGTKWPYLVQCLSLFLCIKATEIKSTCYTVYSVIIASLFMHDVCALLYVLTLLAYCGH